MKAKIHPKYYQDAKVTCACGNSFTTGSTVTEITTEICSACHPFFTGEMKLVDTQGRIERFQEKQKKASVHAEAASKKIKQRKQVRPRTLKEMLKKQKKSPSSSQTDKTPTTKTD